MTWNEKMSVGVGVIDEDHKKLVSLVNELYEGITAGHGKETLGKVLDGLVSYTKMHFAREEHYFVKTGYPGAAAHKKEHDELTRQVTDLQARYKSGQISTLSLELMTFLKNWLINHIQGTDKKYGPHLNAKGIH
jgi:hemerythrin